MQPLPLGRPEGKNGNHADKGIKMKRYHAPKRRDRCNGMSPYARHGKRECQYSPAYYSWRSQHVKRAAHEETKIKQRREYADAQSRAKVGRAA